MTRTIADLPSPPGLPLLGNAHQLRISKLHSTAERWSDSYGPIFRFDLGPRRVVALADVDAIGAALRERPRYDLVPLAPHDQVGQAISPRRSR